MPQIFIIIPCFNEQHRIRVEYFEAIFRIKDVHVVLIDDGSTDSTYVELSKFVRNNVHILRNPKNIGKAETIRHGYKTIVSGLQGQDGNSECFIGYLDADAAISPSAVEEFMDISIAKLKLDEKLIGAFASRVKLSGTNITRFWVRHYVGRLINTLLGMFISNIPYDSQCGLKVFKRCHEADKIFMDKFRTKWLFDLELFLRSEKMQKSVLEIPIRDWTEISGGSLGFRSFPVVVLDMVRVVKEAVRLRSR